MLTVSVGFTPYFVTSWTSHARIYFSLGVCGSFYDSLERNLRLNLYILVSIKIKQNHVFFYRWGYIKKVLKGTIHCPVSFLMFMHLEFDVEAWKIDVMWFSPVASLTITPVSPLRPRLIHISSSYWREKFIVRLKLVSNGNCLQTGNQIQRCSSMRTRALPDESEKSARERIRVHAYYERYFLVQVTCSMNAKGPTWIENIWTMTMPNETNQD